MAMTGANPFASSRRSERPPCQQPPCAFDESCPDHNIAPRPPATPFRSLPECGRSGLQDTRDATVRKSDTQLRRNAAFAPACPERHPRSARVGPPPFMWHRDANSEKDALKRTPKSVRRADSNECKAPPVLFPMRIRDPTHTHIGRQHGSGSSLPGSTPMMHRPPSPPNLGASAHGIPRAHAAARWVRGGRAPTRLGSRGVAPRANGGGVANAHHQRYLGDAERRIPSHILPPRNTTRRSRPLATRAHDNTGSDDIGDCLLPLPSCVIAGAATRKIGGLNVPECVRCVKALPADVSIRFDSRRQDGPALINQSAHWKKMPPTTYAVLALLSELQPSLCRAIRQCFLRKRASCHMRLGLDSMVLPGLRPTNHPMSC